MVPDSLMVFNNGTKGPPKRPKSPSRRPEKSPRRCTKPPRGSQHIGPEDQKSIIIVCVPDNLRFFICLSLLQLRTSQEASEKAQRRPKRAQITEEGPKTASVPGRPQEPQAGARPETTLEGFSTVQEIPKRPSKRQIRPQDRPTEPQEGPGGPQDGPRKPQRDPQ